MVLLGIDYGTREVGVAISEGELAEGIVEYATMEALSKLTLLCKKEGVTVIVVGLPEGFIRSKAKKFGAELAKIIPAKVIFWDETLTSHIAQVQLTQSNYSPKSMRKKNHRVAAALILQSYIDETKKTSR